MGRTYISKYKYKYKPMITLLEVAILYGVPYAVR